jgi:TRAP-type C4-dicarboxylate transport system permease small subunit
MKRLRATVDKLLEVLLVSLMSVMVLNVLWQVFTRFVIGRPSSYTEELARYLLIWVGLVGASYAVSRRMHLSIDLFTERLKGQWGKASQLFIAAAIFLFALLAMVVGGIRLVHITLVLEQTSAALQIKLGYVYLALPISGLLIMFYSVVTIFEIVTAGRPVHPPLEVPDGIPRSSRSGR